jgi:hypothetical protein
MKKLKSRLKSGNACYDSVQNLLSSSLLPTNEKIKIDRPVILSTVLYWCETWSLTVRKECRLSFFKNRVLSRTFGPKRGGVRGEWRRLHNEELYALYTSRNIIWVIKSRRRRWAEHGARMGERWGAYRVLVGKPEGRNHFAYPEADRRIIVK